MPTPLVHLTIDVTQEDINEGCRHKAWSCPVARAVNRRIRPGFTCSVSPTRITIYDGEICMGNRAGQHLSSRATRAFVQHFDHGDTVSPFSFEIALPEEVLHPSIPDEEPTP